MPTRDDPDDALVLDVEPSLRLALANVHTQGRDDQRGRPRHYRGAVGPSPLTLVLHVDTDDMVERIIDLAGRHGGTVLEAPGPAPSGGTHAYFTDPAGFRWEITTEPADT